MKQLISDATMTGNYVNMEIIPTEENIVFEWDNKTVVVYLDDNGIKSIDYDSNEDLNQILEIIKKLNMV